MSVINKKVRQTDITQILDVFLIYKSTKETRSLGMSSVAMTEKAACFFKVQPASPKSRIQWPGRRFNACSVFYSRFWIYQDLISILV